MLYRKLADLTAILHGVWIALLLSGIGLQMVFEWYKPIHNAIVTVTIAGQIVFLGCPLVSLEGALRRKYDPHWHAYHGSFTCYLIKKLFKIEVPPIAITVMLALIAIGTLCCWFI